MREAIYHCISRSRRIWCQVRFARCNHEAVLERAKHMSRFLGIGRLCSLKALHACKKKRMYAMSHGSTKSWMSQRTPAKQSNVLMRLLQALKPLCIMGVAACAALGKAVPHGWDGPAGCRCGGPDDAPHHLRSHPAAHRPQCCLHPQSCENQCDHRGHGPFHWPC